MSRPLSGNVLQAINAETTNAVFSWIISITHPEMSDINITNNTESITSNLVLYNYWPFNFTPPQDKQQNTYVATWEIDNIDRSISQRLRTLTSSPQINISMVMTSEPDTIVWGTVQFIADNVEITEKTITGQIREKNVFNYSVPWVQCTPQAFPGITRG